MRILFDSKIIWLIQISKIWSKPRDTQHLERSSSLARILENPIENPGRRSIVVVGRPIDFLFPRAPLFHFKRHVEHFLHARRQRDFTFDRHRVIERIGSNVFFPGCLLLLDLTTKVQTDLDEKKVMKDSQYAFFQFCSCIVSTRWKYNLKGQDSVKFSKNFRLFLFFFSLNSFK